MSFHAPTRRPRWVLAGALRILLLLLAATPCLSAPVQPGGPDWGWLFDDGAGSSAAAAFGGADGVLVGGAGFDADSPFAYGGNGSLLLDGSGDWAEMATLAGVLNGSTALSISMWVRSAATGQNRAFFGGANPDNADRFGGRYDESGWLNGNGGTKELIKFGLHIGGTNTQYESAGGYQTTSWQHVVFVWESGVGAALYVDGVLDAPSEVSAEIDATGSPISGALSDQTRFLIGNGAKAAWRGRLDEAAVWRSALNADEVSWLHQNSLAAMVAEPSTFLLVTLGLLGLAYVGRPRSVSAS